MRIEITADNQPLTSDVHPPQLGSLGGAAAPQARRHAVVKRDVPFRSMSANVLGGHGQLTAES